MDALEVVMKSYDVMPQEVGIRKFVFNVYGSVDRKYIPVYTQKDANVHSLYIYIYIYIYILCKIASCWIYIGM